MISTRIQLGGSTGWFYQVFTIGTLINTNESPMTTKSFWTPENYKNQVIILNTDPDKGCYSGDTSSPIFGSLISFALTLYTSGE
jgi:hypothetical protein